MRASATESGGHQGVCARRWATGSGGGRPSPTRIQRRQFPLTRFWQRRPSPTRIRRPRLHARGIARGLQAGTAGGSGELGGSCVRRRPLPARTVWRLRIRYRGGDGDGDRDRDREEAATTALG
uniref:Uncharacterized protein n=1 Tax=Oryza sativa subsp. japonica TaxID=39947 RepID=Q5Z4J3_ORYSJ|nr:hypothetical protein [Oryza sativa Japonica Group]BAD62339.1 hypothetical protein [Oryza sativa Japonica Group]